MRIPFDLIAALVVFFSLLYLFGDGNFRALGGDHTLAETLTALAFFWLFAWLTHEYVVRRLERLLRAQEGAEPAATPPARGVLKRLFPALVSSHPLDRHTRNTAVAQAAVLLLYVAFLVEFRWPRWAMSWPALLGLDLLLSAGTVRELSNSLFAATLLGAAPFVAAMVVRELPRYRLHALIARHPRPLGQWLEFELRLTLLPLIFWLLLGLVSDLASWILPGWVWEWLGGSLAGGLLGLGGMVLLAFVGVPWFIVRLWRCRPLPEGEVKARLAGLLDRAGERARGILLWGPAEYRLVNAAVLGPWSRMRYVLIGAGILELMTPEECEAVVGHEIGHLRHRHLLIYLLLFVGLGALSGLLLRFMALNDPLLESVVFLAVLVVGVVGVLGAVFRRFEREADLTAVELTGSPRLLAAALEKVATPLTRGMYSWHHDSIARRIERIETLGADPAAIRAYHLRMRRWRMIIVALSLLAIGTEFGMHVRESLSPPPRKNRRERERGETERSRVPPKRLPDEPLSARSPEGPAP